MLIGLPVLLKQNNYQREIYIFNVAIIVKKALYY